MKYMFHVFWALFAVSASFAEEVDLSTLTGHYEAKNGDILTGTLNGDTDKPQPYKITIADGAEVTLRDATINGTNEKICFEGSSSCSWAGLTCLGNCTIVLEGSNTVKGFDGNYPGIKAAKQVGDGEEYTLTIKGEGSLEASSNGDGAGIGGELQYSNSDIRGNCGNITIEGGTVTATGGGSGVGGGTNYGTCGDITISGGKVTATSSGFGAGIGGGSYVSIGNITISGGKVTATGGNNSAGIGTGKYGTCGKIIISGDEVIAIGGESAAGIGSGYEGISGNITISGGTVTATGGYSSAGIGGGERGSNGYITISGGEVIATGGELGAGIGGGYGKTSGDIMISGGIVTATAGKYAAGIGSGYEGTSGDITISGGKVTATGGDKGAGIGSGENGTCGDITITKDVTRVVATGGTNAPYSVGAGNWGEAGTVTIGDKPVDFIKENPYEIATSVDLSTLTGNYKAEDGDILTGSLAGNYKITIADGAKVTLRDAVINGSNDKSYKWAGLTCLGNCTIDLSGSNIVTGFYGDYPGIQAAKREGDGEEYTLTIEGEGSLEASSNGSGAGIGSGKNSVAGNITISGGKVSATGGSGAAGIGGGKQGSCGNVSITNDVIKVVATKGTDAPYSIGAGNGGKSGSVSIGGFVGAIENSPFIFSAVIDLSTLTGHYEAEDGNILTGSLAGNYKITIADGAKVTLRDATINGTNEKVCKNGTSSCIWAGITCLGNCTIVLEGSNIVKGFDGDYPGIQTAGKNTLTIEGNGSLEAGSNGNGAGIGGGSNVYKTGGNIFIRGGSVTATSSGFGAGIGSGGEGTGGDITISGGTVTATSSFGAGIGGGGEGTGGDITISGGNVTATGGKKSAGIGGGGEGTGGNITISGGEVTATGGEFAAGIGSGDQGTGGDITISGGKVTATGGQYAAGIGSGENGKSSDITISGGEVIATGGEYAAGIGSGENGKSGDITISGGSVTATSSGFGAGIGGGYGGKSGNITITKDVAKVVAIKELIAPYSIDVGIVGEGETARTITIGGEEKAPIEKELFVYPSTLVDIVAVGDKTYAVIDGDYSGVDALNITEDVSVDKVVFDRTFPVVDGEKNYATIMFPFEIDADKIGNIAQTFSFLGIGVDKQNRKIVAVERVWCNDDSKDECNYSTGKFEAYKPYLIQLKSEGDISINNTEPLVLKKTPTKLDAFDVAQSDKYNKYGDYVFRGVVQTKTWGAEDDEVLGTDGAAAYGFASTATTDVKVGQFARVGEGAYIRPFRGYIYKKPVPKKVKSNGDYVLRQTASIDDLPDVMDIVVVDRKKDGSEQTTVIGQFNSRTGEIRMNRTERTYDLKGRSVRDASHMAKGVYLKK